VHSAQCPLTHIGTTRWRLHVAYIIALCGYILGEKKNDGILLAPASTFAVLQFFTFHSMADGALVPLSQLSNALLLTLLLCCCCCCCNMLLLSPCCCDPDPPSRTKAPLIMMKFALLAAAPLAALGIPQGCDICAKDKQEYCDVFPNAAACKTPCGFEVRVAPSLSLSHTHVHIHTHTHRPVRVPLAQHHLFPPSRYSLCSSDGVAGLSDGWVPAALSGYAVRREDKDVLGARNCPGGPRSGER
jgi:hypothetical protein